MKATSSERLTRQVCSEHERLLERLRSLDNCLGNILYHGEVCSDLRGFGGLRQRCQELHQLLLEHIPQAEKMLVQAEKDRELCPLLNGLVEDHRSMMRVLEHTLNSLEALESGAPLTEDLFALQDQVRGFSAMLQRHIHTVNQRVVPRVEAV